MPAAYSLDLRVRVVNAVREGTPPAHAAGLFKVGLRTVTRWAKRLRTTGSCAASPSGGDRRSMPLEAHKEYLLDLTAAEPDLTLAEIQARLEAAHGLRKGTSSLDRFFRRHEITYKKKPCTPPNRTART